MKRGEESRKGKGNAEEYYKITEKRLKRVATGVLCGAIILVICGFIEAPYSLFFFIVIVVIFLCLLYIIGGDYKKEGVPARKMADTRYLVYLMDKSEDRDEFIRRRGLLSGSILLSIYLIVGLMGCWGYYLLLLFPEEYACIISMLVTIITFGCGLWYANRLGLYQMTNESGKQKFDKDRRRRRKK